MFNPSDRIDPEVLSKQNIQSQGLLPAYQISSFNKNAIITIDFFFLQR